MANTVTAKIYGPAQKMRFLPYAFAEFYLQAENYVCSFMKKYAVGYDGGCWEYITYENGACAFTYRKLKNQSIPLSTPYAT
ncbi:hypothetical protein [Escherichia coli]|uniref:hypothetical protein n=1 Tax=Escherichia coli TaxID=562 RepID=UPI002026EDF7|nr:hypothetical protein [Escherichia coli]